MARKLDADEVEFSIECLEEDQQVRGNAQASGDDEQDKYAEDMIIEQLENGNRWAWCTVKVTARFEDLEGHDYLGCCSYSDEEEFKRGGYWEDMKARALNELQEKFDRICSLGRNKRKKVKRD